MALQSVEISRFLLFIFLAVESILNEFLSNQMLFILSTPLIIISSHFLRVGIFVDFDEIRVALVSQITSIAGSCTTGPC